MGRAVQSTWISKETKDVLSKITEKLGLKSTTNLASDILESWAKAMITGKKGRIWFSELADQDLKAEIQDYYNGRKPKLPKNIAIKKSDSFGTFIIVDVTDERKQYGFIVNGEGKR